MVHGQLLELCERADVVVVAKILELANDDTATIEPLAILSGTAIDRTAIAANGNLARGEIHVLFLSRAAALQNLMPRGVVFLTDTTQAASLRRLIQSLRHALAQSEAARPDAVRAALMPCLTSPMTALRYDCAMTFNRLVRDGHGPTPRERRELDRLLARPDADPALAILLR